MTSKTTRKSKFHITRTPTGEAYGELSYAYRFFNRALFGGKLSYCLITLHRHPKCRGYFWGDRYTSKVQKDVVTDEIALNPDHLLGRTDKENLSTLVHEMIHLWQHHHGKASRNGYHNTEWGTEMDRVGLTPVALGADDQPNGKRTGQKVTHDIVKGGPFDKACDELLKEGLKISWGSHQIVKAPRVKKEKDEDEEETESKSGKRAKYTCEECEANVWGKSGLNISCNDCDTDMVEQGGDDE